MNTIPELIEEIRNGRMVILVDDEDRENEGDLVLAADFATPEAINFMAAHGRGLICLAMTSAQCDRLKLPLMVVDDDNRSPNCTAFTVSIEAAKGVSTGISASDRAHTIRVASNPLAKPSDIIMPGHVFPIRAQKGGVLKRAGHTEGSIDMAVLAGLNPAAVICEIMKPDGTMARIEDLRAFAKEHNLKMGTIEDLIRYRLENETLVEETAAAKIDVPYNKDITVRIFRSVLDGSESVVLQKGEIDPEHPTLVRVQVANLFGDVFGSFRHFTGQRIHRTLKLLSEEKQGVLVYLQNPSRFQTLTDEVKFWGQDAEHPTFPPMDEKDYGLGAQILRSLGVKKIRLLTNQPSKRVGLPAYGLEIVDEVPLFPAPQEVHLEPQWPTTDAEGL